MQVLLLNVNRNPLNKFLCSSNLYIEKNNEVEIYTEKEFHFANLFSF